jgi:hypothetical protein
MKNKILPVIDRINDAFAGNEYPGDDYLLGSTDGCEPLEEIQPFKGETNWAQIPSEVLDKHSGALNFFSEAGFRFFLPAYLVADMKKQLLTADPVFVLVHGFTDLSVSHEIDGRIFERKTGKDAFINPRRYGALTFEDYSRFRLSVFTSEEAGAIVDYLEFKRDSDPESLDHDQIQAALETFWYERVQTAPQSQSLVTHLREEDQYLSALMKTR